MPSLYTPGAIEHYVKFRDGSTVYLGTANTAPEIEVRPAYLNVINDLGGRTVPFQKVPDREQHIITTTLNRFDWTTYKDITGALTGAGGAEGSLGQFQHGVLALGFSDFELILVYALAGTGVIPADFPRGRRYWSVVCLGAKESTIGTRVQEVSLVLEANALFDASLRVFDLYTEVAADVLSGLPALT